MRHGNGHGGVALEGDLTGDHLIHGNSEGIDVAARIAGQALGLFRRDVVDRSHRQRPGRLGGDRPGDAEVRHLHLAVTADDDVLGFDIPVDNVVLMGGGDALGNLKGHADGFLGLHFAFFLNVLLEGDSVHQLHHDIVQLPLVHNVVDVDNVGVGQAGRCLSFHLEFLHKGVVGGKLLLQHLDGHQAV